MEEFTLSAIEVAHEYAKKVLEAGGERWDAFTEDYQNEITDILLDLLDKVTRNKTFTTSEE